MLMSAVAAVFSFSELGNDFLQHRTPDERKVLHAASKTRRKNPAKM